MNETIISVKQLRLGDTVETVRPSGNRHPWSTAMVVQVTEEEVTLFRPYGHLADFSYTGGVIPYVGTETYKLPREFSSTTFYLLHRKELK